ncbi:hypothetical protein E4U54_006556 [Claviceps lovelessii]|nr:hypothetical protein E4U54_006556 [Claviceps lovelessii]
MIGSMHSCEYLTSPKGKATSLRATPCVIHGASQTCNPARPYAALVPDIDPRPAGTRELDSTLCDPFVSALGKTSPLSEPPPRAGLPTEVSGRILYGRINQRGQF